MTPLFPRPNNSRDVVVAGGGIIGLSVAWRLVARGWRVSVLDAAAPPAASDAAAGMLAPSFERGEGAHPVDGAEALFAFGRRSLAQWADFAREIEDASGLCVDYQSCGAIGVAVDAVGVAALDDRAADLTRAGVAFERLDGVSARALEPTLSQKIIAALRVPSEAQVDASRMRDALRAALRRRGAAIETGARLVRHQPTNDGVRLDVSFGSGVETRLAARLVIATGAAAVSGAPRPVPVKGEALSLSPFDAAAPRPRIVVRGRDVYVCPKGDGRVVVGATEIAGADDVAPRPEAIDDLRARATSLCPALEQYDETARWAGVRPGAPDGSPLIGPDPGAPKSVAFALGHYRNGVLLAPATADLIANVLEARPPSSNPFDPARLVEAAALGGY
ncbi:MAG: glycine oxidase ThiO [Parvularculaceae bacterium]